MHIGRLADVTFPAMATSICRVPSHSCLWRSDFYTRAIADYDFPVP